MQQPCVELAACPPPFEIHAAPDGAAVVTFYGGAQKLSADGEADRWRASCYMIRTRYSDALATRIEQDYEIWFAAAQAQFEAVAASEVRAERDRRLAACDYRALPDYRQPDDEREAWTAYRQALRDVPEQVGFPYDVRWPEPPDFE